MNGSRVAELGHTAGYTRNFVNSLHVNNKPQGRKLCRNTKDSCGYGDGKFLKVGHTVLSSLTVWLAFSEQEGKHHLIFRTCTSKSRPESGLTCLIRVIFTRQRDTVRPKDLSSHAFWSGESRSTRRNLYTTRRSCTYRSTSHIRTPPLPGPYSRTHGGPWGEVYTTRGEVYTPS